jgi:hypothetical protein
MQRRDRIEVIEFSFVSSRGERASHKPPTGRQAPMTHWLGATQSTALWQGEAHLPAWTLQWYQPQIASL